jgi:hypothetical protein
MKKNKKKYREEMVLADQFTVGNLKVTKLVDQSRIDAFVSSLPPEKKADVKDVIMALHEEGLINIEQI